MEGHSFALDIAFYACSALMALGWLFLWFAPKSKATKWVIATFMYAPFGLLAYLAVRALAKGEFFTRPAI